MKNFRQVREFNMAAHVFLNSNGNNSKTKLGYAIQKVTKQSIKKVVEDYNFDKEFLNIEHCHTDENDVIVYDLVKDHLGNDQQRYRFSKKGLKAKMQAEKKFVSEYDEKTFEIKSHIVKDVPAGISEEHLEAFDGFVITLPKKSEN